MSQPIPLNRAAVVWGHDRDGYVSHAYAYDHTDPEAPDTMAHLSPSTAGGVLRPGWLLGDDPAGSPAGLFGLWLTRGFANPRAAAAALDALADIDGCGWAREMCEAINANAEGEPSNVVQFGGGQA